MGIEKHIKQEFYDQMTRKSKVVRMTSTCILTSVSLYDWLYDMVSWSHISVYLMLVLYIKYVTRYTKTDHLQFFFEICVFGTDRRRIYCRVQWSKSQALKRFLGRVMSKKLYMGHPCLSSQFFEKRSDFVRTYHTYRRYGQ